MFTTTVSNASVMVMLAVPMKEDGTMSSPAPVEMLGLRSIGSLDTPLTPMIVSLFSEYDPLGLPCSRAPTREGVIYKGPIGEGGNARKIPCRYHIVDIIDAVLEIPRIFIPTIIHYIY